MKREYWVGSVRGMLFLALVISLSQASCTGERGPKGSTGPAGPPGTPPTRTDLTKSEDLPGVVLAITEISGGTGPDHQFEVGDRVSVTFTVKKGDGTSLPIGEIDYGAIMVSGPTFNYQRVLKSQSDLTTASSQNSDGSYTYTFAKKIPENYLAPLNDTASFGSGDGELKGQALLDGTYTVGIEVYKNYTVDGESVRDAGNITADFLFGGATTLLPREETTRANCNRCHIDLQAHGGFRRNVTLCLLCHTSGAEDKNVASVEGGTPGASIDSRVMFHKIHNGRSLPSVVGVATLTDGSGGRNYSATATPYKLVGYNDTVHDFSDVVFPVWPSLDRPMPRNLGYSALSSTSPSSIDNEKTRDDTIRKGVVACDKCHDDPDGSGALPAPAQGDIIETQPTRRACGSCHDDVNWSQPYTKNGLTMPAQDDDSSCVESGCHGPEDDLAVEKAHRHPIVDSTRNPGVNFHITGISGGTGAGGNFQAGDSMSLTFTVKDDAGDNIALESLDSVSATMVGPNDNRQFVLPSASISPFDFSGRLATASTTNKAAMSKVIGAIVSETLTVQFSSATAFEVTGSTSGSLGSSALPASPSTNPSGSSLSGVALAATAVAQTITVAFSSATAFAVTGSVSGAMGSGELPASLSASTRFTSTDGTVAFNLTAGTTAFAAGNNIYLVVFKGSAANPVLVAVVAGRSSVAANDRIYYEVVAAASSYTIALPMDLILELLGEGDGAVDQELAAANLPVYYGRQTLYERTALVGTATELTSDASAGERSVDVASLNFISSVTGAATTLSADAAAGDSTVDIVSVPGTLAANDYVVLDNGVVGKQEYLRVSSIDTANKRITMTTTLQIAHASGAAFQEVSLPTNIVLEDGEAGLEEYLRISSVDPLHRRIWMTMPLRYDHASGASFQEATLTYRQEGVNYSLDPATGTVTSIVAFGDENPIVMSYRTDARFGWKRDPADTIQATYFSPIADSSDYDETWGEWTGLSFLSGTYSAGIWGYKNLDLGLQNELQTYRLTSEAAAEDFLYGTAEEVEPRAAVSSPANCDACHDRVLFHGGGRRGLVTCLFCHGEAGAQIQQQPTEAGETIDFRTMLHKIHMGGELTNADTYFDGDFEEVTFPAAPGEPKDCGACHGREGDAWKSPAPRTHEEQTLPTRAWRGACGSCHDSVEAGAHINVQTDSAGDESCGVCHGTDAEFRVELMHKIR